MDCAAGLLPRWPCLQMHDPTSAHCHVHAHAPDMVDSMFNSDCSESNAGPRRSSLQQCSPLLAATTAVEWRVYLGVFTKNSNS